MSKKKYHNTSTKKRQTDQSPLQPKAYLTSKHRLQNCHESNRKKTGRRSTACDKCWWNWLYQRTVHRWKRTTYDSDIISCTAANNLPGLAIFLDFEKAFDSIEWNFLFKALDKLNFGPDFKNWVRTFYCNITSCVTNNGYASIWSEALDRVSHYQAFSSCSELKFLHLRLRKIRKLRASE